MALAFPMTTRTAMPVSSPVVYVARQPIIDHAQQVFGYELLYRATAQSTTCTADGDRASAQVITDALLTVGLPVLTQGRQAFYNLTTRLLLTDLDALLPADYVVLELREDIPATAETVRACYRLRNAGYALALDDFVEGSPAETFLPYVDFVKVDLVTTPRSQWQRLAQRLRRRGVRLIAEKVETAEQAVAARGAGYDLFQGYFFCRPVTVRRQTVPATQAVYLDLMAAVSRPDVTIDQLEGIIRRDASLSYRVLRCVQSAALATHGPVMSIRMALVLLGVAPLRRWTMIWALAGLNRTRSTETVMLALLRARCCELLATARWGPELGEEGFLVGLCSLLDAILGQPMAQVLRHLPLTPAARGALCGEANAMRAVLDAVVAYERGDWNRAQERATQLEASPGTLASAYADALLWATPFADTPALR